jgi:hypothetical protein
LAAWYVYKGHLVVIGVAPKPSKKEETPDQNKSSTKSDEMKFTPRVGSIVRESSIKEAPGSKKNPRHSLPNKVEEVAVGEESDSLKHKVNMNLKQVDEKKQPLLA